MLLVLGLLVAGCARESRLPTSVASRALASASLQADRPVTNSASQAGFYPLQIGNHWHYAMAVEMTLVPRDGPPSVVTGQATRDATLESIVDLGDRPYVMEVDVIHGGIPDDIVQRLYLRQDATGLFEADVAAQDGPEAPTGRAVSASGLFDRGRSRLESSIIDPARRAALHVALDRLERKLALARGLVAPTGVVASTHAASPPAELVRLRYPLHVGATWVIRRDPLFISKVEALDALALAPGRFPGWRMRYDSELFGPLDLVRVWYGRAGYLAHDFQLESPWTNESGDTLGTVITRETDLLDGIDLAGPRHVRP
jgi:hypothetical protein